MWEKLLKNIVEGFAYDIHIDDRVIKLSKLMTLKDTINATFHRIYAIYLLVPITNSVIVLKCINCCRKSMKP